MKLKKLVAIATAITMIVLPLQLALADPLDNQVVTGDAAVDYVDPSSVIVITVPTSASLGFTLDPQNLAATQGVGAWDPSQGGSIIPAAVNILVNQSAVPIKATAHFTLQDPSTESLVLVDKADVNTGTAKNMYLSFVPANAKTTVTKGQIAAAAAPTFVQDNGDDAEFTAAELAAAGVDAGDMLEVADIATATFGQFVETADDTDLYNQVEVPAHALVPATTQTTVSAYTDDDTGLEDVTSAAEISDMTDGTDLAFALNKADYYVVKDSDGYRLELDDAARNDNYDTGSYILSGLINKNADWSGYSASNKITVQAEYSFEIMTPAAYTTAIAAKLGSSHNSISTVPPVSVSGVTVTPATPSVAMGATQAFSASVTGVSNPATTVTWSLSGTSNAGTTIDSDGLLTVAADEDATSLTVTATSTVDNSKTGTATVTVTAAPATVSSVSVTPGTPSVDKGATQDFSATVSGTHSPDQTVTWSVSGNSSSSTTINSSGHLAVGSDETGTSLTVTATSTADNSKHGTATVTVTTPAAVGFTDAGGTLTSSKTYTYSKATNTSLSIGFNFGGHSITSFKTNTGSDMVVTTDYTVTSNSITITAARLNATSTLGGTKVFPLVVNGTTYNINITVTN